MVEVKCPSCGSTNTEYNDDNLDDLFAFEWNETFSFTYRHHRECLDCGEFFDALYTMEVSYEGTES